MRPIGKLAWHRPFAKSYQPAASAPVLWRDRLVVADRADALLGLDATTGAQVWTRSAPPGFHGTPCLADDGRVFAGTGRPGLTGGPAAQLFAIAAADGAILWRRETPSGMVAGPALVGDRLITSALDGCLYAFARDDGALAWRTPLEGVAAATPTVGADGLLWIGSSTGHVHAVRADDGAIVQSLQLAAPIKRAVASSARGLVAVTIDGTVAAIAGGKVAWTRGLGGHNPSAATVAGGRVLLGAGDANQGTSGLYVLDADDGEVRGHLAVRGWIHGAPSVDDGVVYFGATDHSLHAVDLGSCTELWSYGTSYDLWSTPLCVDASLYFTAQNGCYAIV